MDKQFKRNLEGNSMLGRPLTEQEKKELDNTIEKGNRLNPLLENLDYVNDNVIDFANKVYEMLELYSRKNKDYGNSFEKSLDEDGLLVSKIRLMDKMNRFNTLIKDTSENRLVTDETVEDTLMDLASYAIMTIMWMEKGRAKNEQELHVYSDGVKQDI